MHQPDSFIDEYFKVVSEISQELDRDDLALLISEIRQLKIRRGRLFIIGVGGSAGNASHAVNDFRKLAGVEAYAPTDNVSELTARTNDEGWETFFIEWLKISHLTMNDALLVLSVGGGNIERNVSTNISVAVLYAREIGSPVLAILGRRDGDSAKHGTAVVTVPVPSSSLTTPMAESFQALVWHMVVMHPEINEKSTKW
jgi:D-sedoheptulose 7-phosphate isomerase